jgi:NADH dehydrogenase
VDSGLSYAIVRPALVFGLEDILLNNIAWMLRKFPFFAVIGSGEYLVQPVFVGDVAQLALEAGQDDRDLIIDAVGPEVLTFYELVRLISDKIRSSSKIIHVTPRIAYFLSRIIGYFINDIVLTWDELEGLTKNLLLSHGPPTGETRLSEWLKENADLVGIRYASELKRHYL